VNIRTIFTKPLLPIPLRDQHRLRIRGWALLIGASFGFLAAIAMQEEQYGLALRLALPAFACSLVEFVAGDLWTEKYYPARTAAVLNILAEKRATYHDEILRQLKTIKSQLKGCNPDSVSGTVHLKIEVYPVRGAEPALAYIQLTEYDGTLGGREWRDLPATKGIVGLALRTGRKESVSFTSEDDYRTRMVREFGFTHDEVKKHTREARSYLAAPIVSDKRVLGILYLFSTEPQAFPHALDIADVDVATNALAVCLRSIGLVPPAIRGSD